MIRSSVLLLVTLGASGLLRRRSAAERHLILAAALALAAVLPLLNLTLPAWRPELIGRAAAALPGFSRAAAGTQLDDGGVVVRASGVETSTRFPDGMFPDALLFGLWLCGFAAAGWTPLRAAVRLTRLRAGARPVVDASWQASLADVSRRLELTSSVRLLESRETMVPITWGFVRPSILVPAHASTWSADRRRVVMAHELAHVSRADWYVQLVARAVCTLYWFNPLFWIAYSRLRLESERACDDTVLRLDVDACDYARHLVDIARALTNKSGASPALAMATSNLERRFAALLYSGANRRALTGRVRWAIPGVLALLVLPLAVVALPAAEATISVRTAGLPALPAAAGLPAASSTLAAIRDVRAGATPIKSDVGDVDEITPPAILEYTRPPLYSDEARRRRIEGVVTLEVRVDAAGHADILRVASGLGFGLNQNAALAFRTWRLAPATRRGRPIESISTIDIVFSLANEAINELIANDMATRVGQGVLPPRVVRRVAVSRRNASAGAEAPGASGVVILDVVLLEDGTPKVVRIVRSLEPSLDQAAVRAFEQWRFSPAMKDGVPVKVRMNAEVAFPAR